MNQTDREELQAINALRGNTYQIEPLTEDDCRLLAAGLVPSTIRAQCLAMLRFDDVLEANALKPMNGKRQ
jgi:hypothetical protein